MDNRINILNRQEQQYAIDGLKAYFLKIYSIMTTGLLTTAMSALAVFSIPELTEMMFHMAPNGVFLGLTNIGRVVNFSPLIIALVFSFGNHKISAQNAKFLFWIYAILVGMSLAVLGFIYTSASISKTLFICAGMFGGMSLYGYSTKRDLSTMRTLLYMGLFGLILASFVNWFLQSSTIEFVMSFMGVLIFTGLIAYDTQKLKALYYSGAQEDDKTGIMAAFTLYLDFLNLFLFLLRFFGDRRK